MIYILAIWGWIATMGYVSAETKRQALERELDRYKRYCD